MNQIDEKQIKKRKKDPRFHYVCAQELPKKRKLKEEARWLRFTYHLAKQRKSDFGVPGGESKFCDVQGRKYMVNKSYLIMQIRVSQVMSHLWE